MNPIEQQITSDRMPWSPTPSAPPPEGSPWSVTAKPGTCAGAASPPSETSPYDAPPRSVNPPWTFQTVAAVTYSLLPRELSALASSCPLETLALARVLDALPRCPKLEVLVYDLMRAVRDHHEAMAARALWRGPGLNA
jgi:hypothetical protein